jgi:hypothetical protein
MNFPIHQRKIILTDIFGGLNMAEEDTNCPARHTITVNLVTFPWKIRTLTELCQNVFCVELCFDEILNCYFQLSSSVS